MNYPSLKKLVAGVSASAIALTSVMSFGAAHVTAATSFTDSASISSWAADSVSALVDAGVLSGRADGSFDPAGALNRAEMAKVAVLGADLAVDTTGAPHFNDVAPADWFYSFVETLYNNGVVGGINGGALDSNGLATYNPAGTLNRAEAAKILVEAYDLETAYAGEAPNFPDVASSAWFFDYVETAYAHGLLGGYSDGRFGPGDQVTREQVAVIAQAGREEAGLVAGVDAGSKQRAGYTAGAASAAVAAMEEEEEETPVVEASDGTLSVAISADTAPAQTFPQGASSTKVASYDFTASGDDVVITNIVVTRTGVGEESDWTLYLYDGNDRLTSSKTINSTTQQATFTGLDVEVDGGSTKTLTLRADTSTSSTGGDSYFEISAASDVTSNAKSVAGSFPVASNKQEINTSVTAGGVTIEETGSVTNPNVGEDGITIGKLKLTASSTEAVLVEQIALTVGGTIDADAVQNVKLTQSGAEVASVASANSKDLLVFTFDTPYELAKGDSRNFDVVADLNTGRNGDTVSLYVDEDTDVTGTGGTYGFGVSVTNQMANGDQSITLQGGDITISSSGPAATDVAVNADDVTLMDFSITSVSEVTFKKFGIILTTNDAGSTAGGLLNGTTSNYTDIKVVNVDTGATVMGPIDASSLHTASGGTTDIAAATDTTGYYMFQDEFTMGVGDELNLAITADIENNTDSAFTDDTIYASLDLDNTSVLEIRDVNNKTITNSSSVVPSADITGKTMTVSAPTLTVALSSAVVSDTFVKGTADVCYAGFSLQAGDASDVKITELKVDGGSDADGTGWTQAASGVKDIVGSVKLMDGDTQVGSAESVQTDGTATFDNLTYTIDAGATKLLKVCGNISSSISSGSRGVAFAIAATSNITAEDEDGNSVTVSGTASQVATTPDVIMTVSQGGSLTVAVDASTPKEDIAVAGTSDVEVSKFKFTSTDESFIVKKLSINNRQSAVTGSSTLGDYDNNVTSIKIEYVNSDGDTETKTGFLTEGTANFSGMDLAIDKDDDATVTVYATLNTISGGAAAGEYVDMNLAFNDFEATAQGSGETYTAAEMDSAVAADSDLDIGTITWTDSGYLLNGALTVSTPGSSVTATVDTGSAILPVGTLIMTGSDTTYTDGTDSLYVLTAAMSTTSMTMTVIDDDDATAADNLNVYYSLPGSGYLTSANRMHVYESKPTVALSASSPSGSRTVSTSDGIFLFTISADSKEEINIRQAQVNDATANTTDFQDSALSGTFTATDALSTVASGGVGDSAFQRETSGGTNAASIIYTFDAAADLSGYAGISFWVQSSDTANTLTFTADDDAGTDPTTVATISVASKWYFVDYEFGSTTTDRDVVSTLTWAVTDATAVNAATYDVDRITLYKEKINIDVAGDTATAGNATVGYLKEGGSTVATGYIGSIAANDATGTIQFVPVSGTDSDIEISKGTTKTFTFEIDTSTIVDTSTSDDLITASIDLGSASDGTVTAGDFWWYETNSTVKWAGQVSNTTLNSNTLKY